MSSPQIDSISDLKKSSLIAYKFELDSSRGFNINKYKKSVDSLNKKVFGKESTTKMDMIKLQSNQRILPLLNNKEIFKGSEKPLSITKYQFRLDTGDKRVSHSVILFSFSNTSSAELFYKNAEKLALEKSGVPGLTYTTDCIFIKERTIYWLNSSCMYSLKNHSSFVAAFNNLFNNKFHQVIRCNCGEVICSKDIIR